MNRLKSLFLAAGISAAFGSFDVRADDDFSSFLPLAKGLAAGHELPLPLGIAATVYYQEQEMELNSISLDVPAIPAVGLNFPLSGLNADASDIENRLTNVSAKLDAWVLPFLNLYGVLGYVDGESKSSGLSLPNLEGQLKTLLPDDLLNPLLPPVVSPDDYRNGLANQLPGLLPNSFPLAYEGLVYGGGITLAGGVKSFWASVDANYTWADLNIADSSIETLTITPRVGIRGDLGGLNGSVWVGAMYQDVDEHQVGQVKFDILGIGRLPVGYDVQSEAENPWNALVGVQLEISESWNYTIEAGFPDRKQVMATINYRF